jgi:hypothetical protein
MGRHIYKPLLHPCCGLKRQKHTDADNAALPANRSKKPRRRANMVDHQARRPRQSAPLDDKFMPLRNQV